MRSEFSIHSREYQDHKLIKNASQRGRKPGTARMMVSIASRVDGNNDLPFEPTFSVPHGEIPISGREVGLSESEGRGAV